MMFFESSCIYCRQCESICEKDAHHFTDKGHKIEVALCKNCSKKEKCQEICCSNSMRICGSKVTVDDIFYEIIRDRSFYGEKGGVTFSGGEPLLQHEFLISIMKRCKESGISICLDTTLNVDWEVVECVFFYVDIFLVDIKFMNDKQHVELTGTSNRKVLENIKRLSDLGARMIIRMPIIENMNDSEEEMKNRKIFLKDIKGIERIDMIPVSNYGSEKYKALDRNSLRFNDKIDFTMLVNRARDRFETL